MPVDVWDPPVTEQVDFPALLREAFPQDAFLGPLTDTFKQEDKVLPPTPASHDTVKYAVAPQAARIGGGGSASGKGTVVGPSLLPPPPPLPSTSGLPNGPRDLEADRTASQALDDGFAQRVSEAIERVIPQSGRMLESHQIPPRAHDDPLSTIKGWVMMAGRNAGKSFAGARWLHRMCNVPGRPKRCRIIAPSFGDAVASCVEGPSGVIEASGNQAVWKPSHPGGAQVQWPNGSVCYVIGTPTPRDVDRLRAIGNIDYDWFEEAAANPQLHEAERQARLSRRRLGSKWICTTTPRPLPEVRKWAADSKGPSPTVAISEATAFDNPYADPLWLEELETMYAGTLLYQQEVLGKVLEDVAGAIWNAARLERSRIASLDEAERQGYKLIKCAIGVDPANSSGLTGIVAVALAEKANEFNPIAGRPTRHLLVLEDASTPGMSAEAWATQAVQLAYKYDAPIIAENDSGGDAIRAVLKAADHLDRVSIIPARARGRGPKGVRAEPIALLWERDDFRGHMIGTACGQLEEQMTTWVPDDKATAGPTGSPDRVDALVWACTFLWTTSGAGDIEVHLPAHLRAGLPSSAGGRPTEDLMRPKPGTLAPWARASRKKHARK